jgi:hypothetical protein
LSGRASATYTGASATYPGASATYPGASATYTGASATYWGSNKNKAKLGNSVSSQVVFKSIFWFIYFLPYILNLINDVNL